MIKILTYAASSIAAVALVSAAYANPVTDNGRVPHIISSVQFPQSKWRIVRHTFRLQIPQQSNPLSQLSIDVPFGLTVSNKISVSNQTGRKVDTNISVDGNKVILAFPEPVLPGTELKISMKDVKILGRTNAWLYKVYARLVGINADLPIGFARFRVY